MNLKNQIHAFLSMPIWSVLISVIIGILCFMPSENIPEVTGDKSAHFISFAVVSFFWLIRKPTLLMVVLLLLGGVLIEIIQKLLPESFHRGFDYYDILADFIGVFIGAIAYKCYEFIIKK